MCFLREIGSMALFGGTSQQTAKVFSVKIFFHQFAKVFPVKVSRNTVFYLMYLPEAQAASYLL